jgi:hypothetical protein
MKKLRRITEAEVIAEFLQGEFYQKEYDADREQFADIVNHPDLSSEVENTLRQALFFRRRDTLWWELPDDRQWWEIEFEPADIERVSVFPRARWLRLARGNFNAQHVAERARRQMAEQPADEFTAKMAAVVSSMQATAPKGLIAFLGLDEHRPVTLLEGNHRFIASLLAPEKDLLSGARMVAVFSPSMEKCCWYKTSFQTLFRCLKNRIQHYWDRDPDVAGLLQQASGFRNTGVSVEGPGPVKSRTV